MRRRVKFHTVAILGLIALALAQPVVGRADSGGAGIGTTTGPTRTDPQAQPAGVLVSVFGGGFTLSAQSTVLLRGPMNLFGALTGTGAGRALAIQRFDHRYGWVTVSTGQTTAGGAFSLRWRPDRSGHLALRAIPLPRAGAAQAGRRSSAHLAGPPSPALGVTVYPTSIATQFGPGFFGQRTACGETLQPTMLGVANRTLPCGTPVSIVYGTRRIVVPVIDRGPYANGADWDLTQATAQALGMDGTATVGTLVLSSTRH